jgi:mannose-6-phosphate isomerase-like protein (cupin superfamily)
LKILVLTLLATGLAGAATSEVDLYTPSDLNTRTEQLSKKRTQFSSEQLKKYGATHYTMLAHREATGSSEVHEKEADIFYVVAGDARIVTGGKLVNPTTQKPGELRGSSIEGGTTQALPQGSIIHIPAGVPHQLLVENGKPFTYFVVKVIE